jgi:tetratricopeptide (TPR) repeat protein
MAKVSLRVYNREIEGMIEGGLLDESVAHCQHILKTFPMHVETYRLLGKSFLEARRYADAADIFQRILMAVQDDFVAHVGMSIIRDDEGKLDDAIWHMERAFEDQPSNPAIQGELRRLYGRRDGVEPSKIRLSRDALANMYSQGELFNQAIAEIRAVLAEDANRPDLQVMLARAYYRAGKKIEAAEIASNLLKKYTYCLDALRILVDVLPGNARVENTQVYRQRLGMLDPYSPFVAGSTFSIDQVADAAVNLERLEYKAGAAPALLQPNWASSLGIKLVDEKRVEPAPDWMRTAVWQDSSGAVQEEPVDSNPEQPMEPLAQADIPDWLKSMAPKEVMEAENAGSKSAPAKAPLPSEEDAPDWLAELVTPAADSIPESSLPVASSQEKDAFPDWLKEMGDNASSGSAAAFAADLLAKPHAEEPPVSSQPVSPPPTTQAPVEPTVSAAQPIGETAFQPAGEPKPLRIEDDAMAWLEGLAAKQGAKEEELLTKPENRSEEMPDWLRPAGEQPPASVAPEMPPEPHETLPLEPLPPLAGESAVQEPGSSDELLPSTFPAEGIVQPINIEDDTNAWLESLEGAEGAKVEELLTKPENRSEEIPDWVRSEDNQPSASIAPEPSLGPRETLPLEPLPPLAEEKVAQKPEPSEELPPPSFSAEGTVQPLNIEDDTIAWLESLAAKQGAKEEELLTKPERPEEIPDWLRPAGEQPPASVAPEMPPAPHETLPLEPLPPLAAEKIVQTPEPSEELPPPLFHIEGTDQPLNVESVSIAGKDGFAAEEASKLEELLTSSGERSEIPPDRIQETTQEPAALDESLSPETSQEDITITSWLKKQDVMEALGRGKPTPVVPQPETTPSNELPDWLKERTKPAAAEETLKPAEELPDWLRQPVQPADQGAAAVPTDKPTSEPEIPAWVDETIPVSEPPAPTTPEEWIPVDEKPAPVPELEPTAKPASFAVETPEQLRILGKTGMLARIPAQDKDGEFLAAAQAALDANQLDESMQAYSKLIKKNRLLDEVIHDLREAIYRFPVDIIVWQTLGDASMRANRLQDALDAYTKAEELLR